MTLQPDVIIVGGGGTSIRNGTDDGLTYYLDPAAPHASDLVRGKVMFVTGRVVGRVVDVRRAGADLAVTIGPVNITDVIRDAKFSGQSPVSLSSPTAYPAGYPSWAADPHPDDSTQVGPSGLRRAAAFGTIGGAAPVPVLPQPPNLQDLPAVPGFPEIPGRPPQLPPTQGGFGQQVGTSALKLVPSCCEGGVGAHFTYDKNGVRLVGDVALQMSKPSINFDLVIEGGSVTTARLQLSGAGGLKVRFKAAKLDSKEQVNEKIAIPVDFSVSLSAFGVPLSAVVNQWLIVKTAFSARGGSIEATGEYTFKAGLGFGYSGGGFSVTAPTSLTVKQSLIDSLSGVSLGPVGVVIGYQARFLIGLGAFGFTAGVYFGLTASLGITRGSDAGVTVPGTGGTIKIVCRGAELTLDVNYGVGYSIPKVVEDVVNFFFRAFKTKYVIKAADGIGWHTQVYRKKVLDPDVKICGGKG